MRLSRRAELMRRIGWTVSTVLFTGCSLISPVARPEPEAFLLALNSGGADSHSASQSSNAQIAKPAGARVLLEQEGSAPAGSTSRILFVSKKGTLGSYQFAQWAEPPANVFQRVFFDRLRKSTQIADISTSSGLIAADRLVRFRIERFWLDSSVESSPVARVDLDLSIIDLEHRRTVGQQSFSETIPVGDPSAEATVRALTEAGRRAVERAVVWMQETFEAR